MKGPHDFPPNRVGGDLKDRRDKLVDEAYWCQRRDTHM